jgi:hypothetical protein
MNPDKELLALAVNPSNSIKPVLALQREQF